jgi:RNA polymerase sigma-70 factor, ECF subfamily
MTPETRTTTLLLDSLRDSRNSAVWSSFDRRYRPVIEGVARRFGLSHDLAAEVAQQTLADFAIAFRAGKYVRGRGRLRSFLLSIARNRAVDVLRARRNEDRGGSALLEAADDKTLSSAWDAERVRVIASLAMADLRKSPRASDDNIDAFEMLVLRGLSYEEVATACNMSIDNLYVIKNRLAPKLRDTMARLTAEYDHDE